MLDPTALLGTWSLERTISDRAEDEETAVSGTLTLRADGDDVVWSEVGRWSRRGGLLSVSRTLRVVRRADGWWVLFEDGRDFHPWTPGRAVVHPCGADTYRGLVETTGAGWRVTWQVSGPAKDYTMVTDLLRP